MSIAGKSLSETSPIRVQQYLWFLATLWTVAVGVVLTWELLDEEHQAAAEARSEALGIWKKEYAIYRWAISQGTVYVPESESTPPDPNLADVKERDVATPSGRKLTIVSPPSIMRQIFAFSSTGPVSQGHISSLRPIQPRNAPDPWEKSALEAFATGQKEVFSEETLDGKPYYRFIRPLVTEPACLTCHFEEGHKVGDIRGGLSISLPKVSIWESQGEGILHRIIGYGGMWLLGLGGIGFLSRHLRHQIQRRGEAERQLQDSHDLLERRVAERTAELSEVNRTLAEEIADRKQAEQWLLESEQRFRGYFEQGLVGMAILTAEQEWDEVNQRLCKMLGYLEEELLVKGWRELISPDDQSIAEAQMRQLFDGSARRFMADVQLLRKEGRSFLARLSAQSLHKPDGSVDCILLLVQDVARQP
jgi:PAS domain S-box-containing protein